MPEIIPNWHPIFVHFTFSLFTISVCFYLISYLSKYLNIFSNKITVEFKIVARWCLWVTVFLTIFTVAAGLYAYNTVEHDKISHAAMTEHRNFALITAGLILVCAAWSTWFHRKNYELNIYFIIGLLITQALLISTAWRGGELVYRHGLGVMSLPKKEEQGYHHHMHETADQPMNHPHMPSMENHSEHKFKN